VAAALNVIVHERLTAHEEEAASPIPGAAAAVASVPPPGGPAPFAGTRVAEPPGDHP
jgi:hypothetical protein